jgi:hypothetical protein
MQESSTIGRFHATILSIALHAYKTEDAGSTGTNGQFSEYLPAEAGEPIGRDV